ncbi:unnamed protein product, partial [marine sediment metagenome]
EEGEREPIDLCFPFIISVGETFGADENACTVGWIITVIGAIVALLLLQNLMGGKK